MSLLDVVSPRESPKPPPPAEVLLLSQTDFAPPPLPHVWLACEDTLANPGPKSSSQPSARGVRFVESMRSSTSAPTSSSTSELSSDALDTSEEELVAQALIPLSPAPSTYPPTRVVRTDKPKDVQTLGRNQLLDAIKNAGFPDNRLDSFTSTVTKLAKEHLRPVSYTNQKKKALETVEMKVLKEFSELDGYEERWPLKYLLIIDRKNAKAKGNK
ncbi:hypothetical protein VNI00_018058 [Paramarasmius palmivorus]|uniref:Uncharacterized protein n=1 Tax=Paramarasmius palmivorus TaxID=297713 RepID=A0AAW0B2V1_9AGAR